MSGLLFNSSVGLAESNVSTLGIAGQVLVLIASDGQRVSVSRAIATEASYVLRDLLDEQDLSPSFAAAQHQYHVDAQREIGSTGTNPSVHGTCTNTSAASGYPSSLAFGVSPLQAANPPPLSSTAAKGGLPAIAITPRNNAATAATSGKSAIPDLMDFFPIAPLETTPTASPSVAAAPPFSNTSVDVVPALEASSLQQQQQRQQSNDSPESVAYCPSEVELPFPHLSGDILERVCRHMSYRFCTSSFGTEDGCYRVYAVKTRVIPKPMVLPLVEYLDAQDRRFIADWDELITVQMVKAATLLNYEELLQLASAKLASFILERDIEGVRTLLGADNDFDPAEEVELKKEQQPTDFSR